MAGRRPGPAPKDPDARMRTNADPVVGRDGWTEFDGDPFDGEVPPIPAWVNASPTVEAIYAELSRLPQARLWGAGTWFELHLTLPLLARYLSRPGSENFKAVISTLGAGLRLTEDDMQRARVRVKQQDAAAPAEGKSATVTAISDRRTRLSG